MADVTMTGKDQGVAQQGTFRIEYDNDRIIYTVDGIVRRSDDTFVTSYFDENGALIGKVGVQDDGRFATSSFDPITGDEIYRNGHLPDDTYGAIYPKEGYSVQDVYAA